MKYPPITLKNAVGPQLAKITLTDALKRAGADFHIFARTAFGGLEHGPFHRTSGQRVLVWRYMRAAGLSYPLIGWACGVAHSTVIAAMRKDTKCQ